MKKIFLLTIFLFSLIIYGEEEVQEFNIDQPQLEELSVITIRDEIKSSEIILVMSSEINKLKRDYALAEKRMDLMDKIIADKNQLTDELENKIEIINLQLKDYQEREKNSKEGFEKNILRKIYEIGAIVALIIFFIFIITFSILIFHGIKTKKKLEEIKELLELNKIKQTFINRESQKYASEKENSEIKDDFNFIVKG